MPNYEPAQLISVYREMYSIDAADELGREQAETDKIRIRAENAINRKMTEFQLKNADTLGTMRAITNGSFDPVAAVLLSAHWDTVTKAAGKMAAELEEKHSLDKEVSVAENTPDE